MGERIGMYLIRREFLRLLAAAPVAVGMSRFRPRRRQAAYLLNECRIAGFQFHDGPGLLGEMRVGEEVAMIAEPGNPHDKFAVRLEYRGRHIGYLPRNQNRSVSRLLRQAAPVRCHLGSVRLDAKPWETVTVRVSITVDAAS